MSCSFSKSQKTDVIFLNLCTKNVNYLETGDIKLQTTKIVFIGATFTCT